MEKAILVKRDGIRTIGNKRFANYLLIPFVGGKWDSSASIVPLTIKEAYKFAKKRKYDLINCTVQTFPDLWEQSDAQKIFDESK